MQVAEIKEYLGMLVDLEKQVYTQNQLIRSLKNNISSMSGKPVCYELPEKEECMTWGQWLGCSIPLAALMITGVVSFLFFEDPSLFGNSSSPSPFFGLLMLFGTGVLLFLGMGFIGVSPSEDRKRIEKEYDEAMAEYCSATEKEERRAALELQKRTLLEKQLTTLMDTNRQTKENLQKLYNYNIIHPKYRGLIPVCSLYGYFDTGVCTQLEGHEGAYNKYDTESRLDYIICQLDEVIRHLEDIKNNQYQLYAAIKESNRKYDKLIQNTQNVMNQLNGIQAQGAEMNARIAQLQTTSDLALYESACSRQELTYLNRMNQLVY